MSEILKNVEFNVNDFFDLFSETTDDYLYIWDINSGIFHISKNAYRDLNIDSKIEQNVISSWSNIMVDDDVVPWLEDMQLIQKGIKNYHDMEYRLYNRTREIIWVSCRGKVKKDAQSFYMVGRISNIGKQNKFDNITGLMNRIQFENDLKKILERENATKGIVAVLDIDNFKNVNEKYSYSFGDQALNLLSTKLLSLLPNGCKMYRLDGDEFAFFIENGNKELVIRIYENIQLYASNIIINGQTLFITVSAGVSIYPKDGQTYQILFRHAENALDIAKMNGKKQLEFFSREIYNRKLRIIELQESLYTCVNKGCNEFELFFQPQIDTCTKKIIGAEALLRWHSSKHGEVSPVEFIPLLEESNLIVQVGKWVIEEGIKQLKKWREWNPDFTISINVSYIQLKENALLKYLKNSLHHKSLINNLILELTESCWVPNLHFLNQEFKDINEMGYRIAIDDFGTGYSSLSHLKELPASVIKIDRSFIKGIKNASYEYVFLEYIVKLAHLINLKVCIEGVETLEEFNVIKHISPDYIQGFLFGKPVSAIDFENYYFEIKGRE